MEIALVLIQLLIETFKDFIVATLGILFVWFALAVITSGFQEWIGSMFNWEATILEDSIHNMLGNEDLKNRFYSHPIIQNLHTNQGKRRPKEIPADEFTFVLFDILINSEEDSNKRTKASFKNLQSRINTLIRNNSNLKKIAILIDTLIIDVEYNVENPSFAIIESRERIENWFNNSMDRLGGAYRRRMQIISIIVGVSVAASLNADSYAILNYLWKYPVVRQAVAAQASQLPESNAQTQQPPNAEEILKNIDQLNTRSLPIGWIPDNIPTNANSWIEKIIGILLSGIAGAQGAPYWIDFIKKPFRRNPTATTTSASQ